MGGILGGGSNAKQQKAVGSLQFQTSQRGGVIPLVYGTTRVSPNLIDYDDFKAKPAKSSAGKGGGGGKGGSQQYNYSASVIMGLAQGPITGIGTAWWDKNVGTPSSLPAAVYPGADGETPDPYWQTYHPAKALSYSATATVVANNYQMGNTATLPNFSFEVIGILSNTGSNGLDANPAAIVADFLTNPRYGAGFPIASLDSLTSYSAYCQALGIMLSPMLDTQQEAQQHLADIVKITNSAIVWSGTLLKIIPYGDLPLSISYTIVTLSGSVAAGNVIGLTFTNATSAGFPHTASYTLLGTDTIFFAAYGLLTAINDDPLLSGVGISASGTPSSDTFTVIMRSGAVGTAIGGTAGGGASLTIGSALAFSYTPDTTPVYSLGEDDFIVQESSAGAGFGVTPGGRALRSGASPITGGFNDDPVHISRSTPADANNSVQLECLDRANNYSTAIVEASDQASIDLYGIRRDTSLKARAIVDPVNVAPVLAQLMLQRALLFRNTYTFKLGWKYCLLEPMDLVEITDSWLGAVALIVRITAVEEDNEGTLSITAEDFFAGYSTAPPYPKQSSDGYLPNWNSAPGSINTPVIFEPPAGLLSGNLEIWVAVSGGPNWGGAQVWISSDGSSYSLAGTVNSAAKQGTLTADLPPHSSPDTTDTLSVDLTESQSQLASASATDAANLITLCYVGGELVAYQTATLTGLYKYDLAMLYRGAYGSTIADHPPGTQFARLDGSIGRFSFPNTLIGQTVYLKFPSVNIVGGGAQSLADVPAYTHMVTGVGQAISGVVSGSYNGAPTANLVLQRYVFATAATFAAGLPGSQGHAGIPATASTTVTIQKNGTGVGTMVFAASTTTATFTMATATMFAVGDVLTLVAPAMADATLANLAWTFTGTG